MHSPIKLQNFMQGQLKFYSEKYTSKMLPRKMSFKEMGKKGVLWHMQSSDRPGGKCKKNGL